ncbi:MULTISPECIES: CPBP family intramembrane glutamic endopeptidase [unclassified Clostridium]|uniref:CPBP family intramembrane glutamic endopeptidase n=1 Tax=unclassified Clostridium TaxID=2614128 RepID=UPI0002984740|nr:MULTISPECIES: CPBP family intramembrane glutamic endopeptidase [unclassified Clostridium]EKQ50960.1 MAG: CAAX amino terminal protease family [Clostridium sp. Maddingley MBC34-26]
MFNNINRLKEKKMFKDLEHSEFLPNGFLILLVFAILWGGSFGLGRLISTYLLKDVTNQTLGLSLRSIITCGFQIFIFFLWVRFIERRKFSTVGFRGNSRLYKFIIGFFIGIISITIITFILFLAGAIQIEIVQNINMSISSYIGIIVIVAGWLVQSASEEIGIRGWLIPLLGAKYNPLISILVTSITFGVLHLFVPTATILSFANLILSGIFFALYAISEDSLLGVWGCHFGWNLALGNIYAFSVSGFSPRGSAIFKIKVIGDNLLTGGQFGPEGGLLATLIVIIGIIICCIRIKKSLA